MRDMATIQAMSGGPAHRNMGEIQVRPLLRWGEYSDQFTIPIPDDMSSGLNETTIEMSLPQQREAVETINSALPANVASMHEDPGSHVGEILDHISSSDTAITRFQDGHEEENTDDVEFHFRDSRFPSCLLDLVTSQSDHGYIFPEQRHFEIDTFVSSPVLKFVPAEEESTVLYLI